MGDMTICPHGRPQGYCDECSPGWEMALITADAQDKIYQRGFEKGQESLTAKLAAAEERVKELEEIVASAKNLIAVKGRFHSEQAYKRLAAAIERSE